MIRLRQVALVAADLDVVAQQLFEYLGLTACFHDPGVGAFGLRNTLYPIGDQLLEVVSPVQDGTTAARLLAKRGGDGGYMVIFETSDLEAQMSPIEAAGVRVVWQGDFADIRGRHLQASRSVLLNPPRCRLAGAHWASPTALASDARQAVVTDSTSSISSQRSARRLAPHSTCVASPSDWSELVNTCAWRPVRTILLT